MRKISKVLTGVFISAMGSLVLGTTALAGELPDNVLSLENGAYRMEIYDIEDGFLEVPFLPELARHDYQWDKLKLKEETGFLQYEDERYTDYQIGIDVSKFQGNIDWEQVAKSNIDFAIVRLGYRGYSNGKLMIDPKYVRNMKGASDAGVRTGVYFFSQAVNKGEALEEARLVINSLAAYEVDFPVAFDTEKIKFGTSRTKDLTVEELTEITDTFCSEVKKAGYRPVIYANAQWLTTKLDLTKLTDYEIWYADYEYADHGDAPLYPYDFAMWQYTNKGKVAGIDGDVDLNILFE